MSGVTVRRAAAADGAAIAEIQLATWKATYSRWIPEVVAGLDPARTADNWSRAAQRSDQRVAVAVDGDRPVGYAWSGPPDPPDPPDERGVGELLALYVRPEAQGRGAGRLLVADALAWLVAAGYRRCLVWSLERYAPARRFYERAGFVLDDGLTRPWRGLTEVRYSRDLDH